MVCLTNLLRARYAPHLERPQFSDLIAECKEILAGVGKILESMAVKNLGPESEVIDERGPEVVAESVSLQEEIFSRSTEVEKAHY